MGDAAENAGGDAGDAGNRIRLFIEMLCCKMESCNRNSLYRVDGVYVAQETERN